MTGRDEFLISEFENSIAKILSELSDGFTGKSFLVALSGGADSVSLLCAMHSLSQNNSFKLIACHVNHMIRGDEADRDEEFCKRLCKALGVELFVTKTDIPTLAVQQGESLELCARNFRYSYFEELCVSKSVDFVCTAHNANDNAETVLFNVIRGSGIVGISGIPQKRGKILRPLLNKTRKEILSYLTEMNQQFVTDSTNTDVAYTRNYIRNILVPCAEKVNSDVVSSLNKLSFIAKQDCEYLDTMARNALNDKSALIAKQPYSIKSRMIKMKYKMFCLDDGAELSYNNIQDICSCLEHDGEARCFLPGGVVAVCSYGELYFEYKNDDLSRIMPKTLRMGLNKVCDGVFINIELSDISNKNSISAMLSADVNIDALTVRSRKEGDKFTVRGINRTVKKCFVDKKIPLRFRDIIPIICDDEGIVFVPYIGVADRVFAKGRGVQISVLFDERFGLK